MKFDHIFRWVLVWVETHWFLVSLKAFLLYIYISQSSGKGIMQKMSKVVFFFNFVTVLEQFLAWRAPEQNTDTSYLLQCFAVRILKVAGRECLTSY